MKPSFDLNRFKHDPKPVTVRKSRQPSIQSTVQPPKRISYNEWFAFIHRIKPIQNTVKDGGVCYSEVMESVLNEAKSIVNAKPH